MEKKVNLLTVLNVILLLSVGTLFYLHFAGKTNPMKEEVAEVTPVETQIVEEVEIDSIETKLNIAYIRSDDMLVQLNLVKTLQQQLQYQEQKYEEDLANKLKEVETKMKDLEREVQNKTVSMNVAKIRENELMKEQQGVIALRDRYTQALGYQEMQVNKVIIDSIENFLNRYNNNGRYDFIVNNVSGNDFLYVDKAYDITEEITNAMNKEYK
jgi:outer membrane protein